MHTTTMMRMMVLVTTFILLYTVNTQRTGIVIDRVANLFEEKPLNNEDSQPLLTQLLFQECVELDAAPPTVNDTWVYVRVPFQTRATPDRKQFVPYEGFLHTDHFALFSEDTPCPIVDLIVVNNNVPLYRKDCSLGGCVGADIVARVSMGTNLFLANDHSFNDGIYSVRIFNVVDWELVESIVYVLASDVTMFYDERIPDHYELSLFDVRDALARNSKLVVGWPYAAGGRSSYDESSSTRTGLDAAGLTSLLYLTSASIRIPRDVNSQYWFANKISERDFAPGDLFFLSRVTNKTMFHVMMYIGDGLVVESTTSSESTRIIKLSDKLKVAPSSLTQGRYIPGLGVRVYWARVVMEEDIDSGQWDRRTVVIQSLMYALSFGSILIMFMVVVFKRCCWGRMRTPLLAMKERVSAANPWRVLKENPVGLINIVLGKDDDSDPTTTDHGQDLEEELHNLRDKEFT